MSDKFVRLLCKTALRKADSTKVLLRSKKRYLLEDSFGRWFLKVLWKIFPSTFSKNYCGGVCNEVQIFLHLIDVGVRAGYQSRERLHIPEDLLSVFCKKCSVKYRKIHGKATCHLPNTNQFRMNCQCQYISIYHAFKKMYRIIVPVPAPLSF